MKNRILDCTAALFLAAAFFLITGCGGGKVTVGDAPRYEGPARGPASQGGPPPWAPAHGYRAKHRYLYYPSPQVYFDTGRNIYFYYRSGQWEVSAQLPRAIRVQLGQSVTLDMNTEKPYQYHSEVIKRYPPGQKGKSKKGKPKR